MNIELIIVGALAFCYSCLGTFACMKGVIVPDSGVIGIFTWIVFLILLFR